MAVGFPRNLRDEVLDFVRALAERTELVCASRIVAWLGVARGKFWSRRQRCGRVNEHSAWIPRDHRIEPEARARILEFHRLFPLEGYRTLTFMMLDSDLAAVSTSTTYRVLPAAGLIDRWTRTATKKGEGFERPLAPH